MAGTPPTKIPKLGQQAPSSHGARSHGNHVTARPITCTNSPHAGSNLQPSPLPSAPVVATTTTPRPDLLPSRSTPQSNSSASAHKQIKKPSKASLPTPTRVTTTAQGSLARYQPQATKLEHKHAKRRYSYQYHQDLRAYYNPAKAITTCRGRQYAISSAYATDPHVHPRHQTTTAQHAQPLPRPTVMNSTFAMTTSHSTGGLSGRQCPFPTSQPTQDFRKQVSPEAAIVVSTAGPVRRSEQSARTKNLVKLPVAVPALLSAKPQVLLFVFRSVVEAEEGSAQATAIVVDDDDDGPAVPSSDAPSWIIDYDDVAKDLKALKNDSTCDPRLTALLEPLILFGDSEAQLAECARY
eukprot:TRINITY_DN1320_c0_g1_i1.p1 TRINITY_DN1320_c0_g1~~TRINITY_DN1320_c0_g1_i1.p1  ORF type:complete len:352 (+),score=47.30 TRINITY_DN1320_c0_g1_i1:52-1107(+)